jgi:predicted  nucleic acid-binding Zn-ribbon protein
VSLCIVSQCALSEENAACYSEAMALTLEDLDRRVSALERAQGETTESLRWVVAKLGRIQAVQDEHTLRLERLEEKVDGVERKLDGLIEALPGIVAEAVRSAR